MVKIENMKKKGTLVEQYDHIIKFVPRHGGQMYLGNNEDLAKEIDYFASIKRLYLIKDEKGRLIATAMGFHSSDPKFVTYAEWPEEDPDGECLFVRGIVIHDALKKKGIMRFMMLEWLRIFPNVKYLMYQRYKRNFKYKLINIEKIIGRTKEA